MLFEEEKTHTVTEKIAYVMERESTNCVVKDCTGICSEQIEDCFFHMQFAAYIACVDIVESRIVWS